MKAYEIRPETIGCYDTYDAKWISLCRAMGYTENIPNYITVIPIELC